MNKENCQKVIQIIKDENNFFNMYNYMFEPNETWRDWHASTVIKENLELKGKEVPKCNTPACIAGWASQLANETDMEGFRPGWCDVNARKFMGLDEDTANRLFQPYCEEEDRDAKEWLDISRDQAIRTLEHLIETGEVNWEI